MCHIQREFAFWCHTNKAVFDAVADSERDACKAELRAASGCNPLMLRSFLERYFQTLVTVSEVCLYAFYPETLSLNLILIFCIMTSCADPTGREKHCICFGFQKVVSIEGKHYYQRVAAFYQCQ